MTIHINENIIFGKGDEIIINFNTRAEKALVLNAGSGEFDHDTSDYSLAAYYMLRDPFDFEAKYTANYFIAKMHTSTIPMTHIPEKVTLTVSNICQNNQFYNKTNTGEIVEAKILSILAGQKGEIVIFAMVEAISE